MQEIITVFYPKKTKSKIPQSNFGDNTFIFENYTVQNNYEAYSIIVSHFILNIPLIHLKQPIRTFRRKKNLDQFYDNKISYIILDIDELNSEFNKQKVLDYFKDYKIILGESRSYNGIDNFNLKGILFTEDIDIKYTKSAISNIHHDLKDICSIDESVSRKASLNAPILKNSILLNNEDGIRFKYTPKSTISCINNIQDEYETNSRQKLKLSDLENIEADTIDKYCLKIFQSMGFEAIRNNPNSSISFKHHSEKKTPGGYFWFNSSPFTMHHANSVKSINIFETIKKLDKAKELMKKEINYDNELLQFNTDTNVIHTNQQYLSVTSEIKTTVQEFLNNKNGLMSIRSPMGTGKSTIIKYIINECHNEDMKVLIITNRISVAEDFKKKYNMKIYNQDKYEIGDSLICQYDSLWKYNIKFFDIVIMDEFISLMHHSRSNLNNSSINIAKFFGSFNKKLVIADAFLTGYENFLLDNKKTNLHLIDNSYRDLTTLFNYKDSNNFVQQILLHAKKHKITVSSTSLNFIFSLQMLLSSKGIKVQTLTAETPQSTKELIYKLFEKDDHDKWDVLIFSPTLTVGVSNLNNIRYHFHYDSSRSANCISSIQMIKRTRKAKEIHIFIKERLNYIKTSYNDIRDEYMGNIGRNIEQNYLFDIDDYGEAKLSYIGKKAIKIDTFKNILEFNHKAGFLWLLQYHFFHEPREIDESFSGDVLNKYKKAIKENKNDLLKTSIEQFLEINNIEKTALLMDYDSDKILRALAEIDEKIIQNSQCSKEQKRDILLLVIKDSNFIQKCKYYKVAFNYTKKIYDITDVKYLISNAVINGNNADLDFYNNLLAYGQNEIFDSYSIKSMKKNKKLKNLLQKCGYSYQTKNTFNTVAERVFTIDINIKKYYHLIK